LEKKELMVTPSRGKNDLQGLRGLCSSGTSSREYIPGRNSSRRMNSRTKEKSRKGGGGGKPSRGAVPTDAFGVRGGTKLT